MRVIGGEFRSRRLRTLPGRATRPTPDRLRETLFDVLGPLVEGAVFVDAYAGTGAVGIEALGRGAAEAIFLENSRAAVQVIQENLRALGLEGRARVISGAVGAHLARYPAKIVFMDPPYGLVREYEFVGRCPAPLVVVQHSKRLELRDGYGKLRRTRTMKQGDNALSFFTAA